MTQQLRRRQRRRCRGHADGAERPGATTRRTVRCRARKERADSNEVAAAQDTLWYEKSAPIDAGRAASAASAPAAATPSRRKLVGSMRSETRRYGELLKFYSDFREAALAEQSTDSNRGSGDGREARRGSKSAAESGSVRPSRALSGSPAARRLSSSSDKSVLNQWGEKEERFAVRNLGVVRYLHSRDDILPPLRNRGGDTLNFCGRLVIELRRSTNAGARRRRGEKTSVICACLAG